MDWFARKLLDWHAEFGRKDLPWQQQINAYRVWISEIMLQQTQVTTVIPYFERFMQRFPAVTDLARAKQDDVLHLWTGLGYYARARNLHKAAIRVMEEFDGVFPETQAELETLPGIGRSTAAAIAAIAGGEQAAILDGNVKRVLTRFHAIPGYPGAKKVENALWALAEEHTPATSTGTYTQAIMDLGATLCTRRNANCGACPVQSRCEAFATGQVEAFPEPKPRKEKPVKQARFFVLQQPSGAVYLERRPDTGIWGGLWTPPERSADCTLDELLRELGEPNAALTTETRAPFRHTFTHFHLDIEPVYGMFAEPITTVAEADSSGWYQPDAISGSNAPIGLSAVAVKLLAAINEGATQERLFND